MNYANKFPALPVLDWPLESPLEAAPSITETTTSVAEQNVLSFPEGGAKVTISELLTCKCSRIGPVSCLRVWLTSPGSATAGRRREEETAASCGVNDATDST